MRPAAERTFGSARRTEHVGRDSVVTTGPSGSEWQPDASGRRGWPDGSSGPGGLRKWLEADGDRAALRGGAVTGHGGRGRWLGGLRSDWRPTRRTRKATGWTSVRPVAGRAGRRWWLAGLRTRGWLEADRTRQVPRRPSGWRADRRCSERDEQPSGLRVREVTRHDQQPSRPSGRPGVRARRTLFGGHARPSGLEVGSQTRRVNEGDQTDLRVGTVSGVARGRWRPSGSSDRPGTGQGGR